MSQTWIIKDTAPVDEASWPLSVDIAFTSHGSHYTGIEIGSFPTGNFLRYTISGGAVDIASFTDGSPFVWYDDANKTLVFDTAPTGELLAWLQKNADKYDPEYLTRQSELTKVASAIREKGGTSAPLVYPTGFVSAIQAIQTGAPLRIVVASTAGSTVTAVQGEISVPGTIGANGICTLIVPKPGTWTITCTKDGNSASKDVIVNAIYPIELVILSAPENWTSITLPSTATVPMLSIAYGNGKFVCFDDSNTQVPFYSSDGVNWTKSSLPTTSSDRYFDMVSVSYCNDRFIAVGRCGGSYGAIFYSLDGITWKRSRLSVDAWFESACYGNGKYVAVGVSSTYDLAYSTNGTSWTTAHMPWDTYNTWPGVAFGNGRFVSIKSSSTSEGNNQAAYSEDGVNWIAVTLPIQSTWDNIAYGNGKFVIKDWGDNHRILYSEDGENWTQATIPSSGITETFDSLFYVNGLFMITTYNNELLYSEDGAKWIVSPQVLPGDLHDIAYGNNKYVATMGNTIYTA